jgi:hypothetical protein
MRRELTWCCSGLSISAGRSRCHRPPNSARTAEEPATSHPAVRYLHEPTPTSPAAHPAQLTALKRRHRDEINALKQALDLGCSAGEPVRSACCAAWSPGRAGSHCGSSSRPGTDTWASGHRLRGPRSADQSRIWERQAKWAPVASTRWPTSSASSRTVTNAPPSRAGPRGPLADERITRTVALEHPPVPALPAIGGACPRPGRSRTTPQPGSTLSLRSSSAAFRVPRACEIPGARRIRIRRMVQQIEASSRRPCRVALSPAETSQVTARARVAPQRLAGS